MGQQSREEERIAGGGPLQQVAKRVGRTIARAQRDELGDLGSVQADELDDFARAIGAEIAEQGQRVLPGLRAPRRRHNSTTGGLTSHQVLEHDAGGRLGPMQIVDDEQQWPLLGHGSDQPDDGLHQPPASGLRIGLERGVPLGVGGKAVGQS